MAKETTSLAVWDIPRPAILDERMTIKVGAKNAAGERFEIIDSFGRSVVSGAFGMDPFPGTEALNWSSLELACPKQAGIHDYVMKTRDAKTDFSLICAEKPDLVFEVSVFALDNRDPLADVEVRAGAYHGRTDDNGTALIPIAAGSYSVTFWHHGFITAPRRITFDCSGSIDILMTRVPPDHPDPGRLL